MSVQFCPNPFECGLRRRNAGEIRERNLAAQPRVVVALDDQRAALLDDLNALERVSARIADDVPEAPDLRAVFPHSRSEHGIECVYDAVDVGQEGVRRISRQ
jgi:hypothetical protein